MDEQHNDHCRLTFAGRQWFIKRIDGRFWELEHESGLMACDFDAGHVRWDEYVEKAVAVLREAYGIA